MPQTLYAFAGGDDAIRRLAHAHYRRCLEDPLLSQVFGTEGSPTHAEHLADWLAEVLGGPKRYTERHGGHEGLLRHHAGRRIAEPQRARFIEVFLAASDEVGLPSDPHFRERLREYLEWGTAIAVDVSHEDPATISSDDPVPVWDWGPQGAPTPSGGRPRRLRHPHPRGQRLLAGSRSRPPSATRSPPPWRTKRPSVRRA